jgi:archaellum component FlaC
MEEIRKHIEENLNDAKREYDNIYYHYEQAKEAMQRAKTEMESLQESCVKVRNKMVYFEKLLNELNDNEI